MDVTPQLLKEVEFREKFRGYDPDEVDDFLERVGLAFTQAQDKVREANDQIEAANARAARAEARARDSSDIDDTLRRTLVLAQRTADAAVAEAREQAASIVSEAQTQAHQHVTAAEERTTATNLAADEAARRKIEAAEAQVTQVLADSRRAADQTVASANDQANRLLMDARRQAEAIQSEARTTADQAAEARRTELAAEVEQLARRRTELKEDADKLEAYVTANRSRVDAVATQLRQLLDDPASLTAGPVPELTAEPPTKDAPSNLLRTAEGDGETQPSSPTSPEVAVSASDPGATGTAEGDDRELFTAPARLSAAGQFAEDTAVDEVDDSSADSSADDKAAEDEAAADGATESNAVDEVDQDRTAAFSVLEADDDDSTPTPAAAAGWSVPTAPSWASGGAPPPPPPPPPRHVPQVSGDVGGVRPGPPPPPPAPGARTGSITDDSPVIEAAEVIEPAAPIAPWLSSRAPATAPTVPPVPTAPAPSATEIPAPPAATAAPPRDSFLDELRRAVGEGGDEERAASAESDDAIRFFEDRDPTDPAAKFLERDGENSRTWFGRKR